MEPNMMDAIAAISAQIAALQSDVRLIKAAIAGGSNDDVFEKPPTTRYVTIRREGESLWYECDRKNKDIHIPVPGDRVTGIIQSLTITEGEYEGEATRKAQLLIVSGETRVVICMNAMLKPKSSVPFKMFLDGLSHVPDISVPITFQVYAGTNAQAVGVRLLKPNGQSFVDVETLTEEDRERSRTQWRDRGHFERLLAIALERINGQSTSQSAPRQQPAPTKPKPAQPAAPDLVLTPPPTGERQLNVVDIFKGMLGRAQNTEQVLQAWEWINGANQQTAIADIPGIVRDATRWKDEALRRVSAAHAPVDVGDAIAGISVEMERLGMSKKEGSERLQKRYGESKRADLTEQQLVDFWQYLRGLQPAEMSEW